MVHVKYWEYNLFSVDVENMGRSNKACKYTSFGDNAPKQIALLIFVCHLPSVVL